MSLWSALTLGGFILMGCVKLLYKVYKQDEEEDKRIYRKIVEESELI